MLATTRHSLSGKRGLPRWRACTLIFASLLLSAGLAEGADASFRLAQAAESPARSGSTLREQRITKRVGRDDTLPLLLMDLGVLGETRNRWHNAVAKELGINNVLIEGDTIHFYFTGPWRSRDLGRLTGVRIERAGVGRLSWMSRGGAIVHHKERHTVPALAAPEPSPPSVPPPASAGVRTPPEPKAEPTRKVSSTAAASATGERALEPVTHVLRKGETLGRVLRRNGISLRAQQPWIKAIRKRYSLKQLYPGHKIILYLVPAPAVDGSERTLRALQIESRRGDLLTWQWADGRIVYRGKNYRVVLEAVPTAPKPVQERIPAAGRTTGPTPGTLAPTRSFEPLQRVIHVVDRGQTLGGIFKPLGVSGKEAAAWVSAIDKQYPVTRIRPGQILRLYFADPPAGNRRDNLRAVELEVRKNRKLTWEQVGKAIRFGKGRVLVRGRATQDTPRGAANGTAPTPRQGAFLSEYALARIKQRNGLLEYIPPPNSESNGKRPTSSLDTAERVTHRLKRGEHLWGVLRRYEEDEKERRLWLTSLQGHAAVRRLRAGSHINLYFKTTDNGSGARSSNGNGAHLQALEIALRSNLRLTWYRDDSGIRFYKDEIPYQQEVRSISGEVTHGSLYGSAKAAGLDLTVISRMVDILGWDINFQRDLQPGDTYRVLYRRKFRQGNPNVARIHVLAAEVVNNGRRHTAIYFEGADGTGHYYNTDGRSVSRSFLRYPVEFSRISSQFSLSRFHPVLKVRRPHYGVDFAAPTGTPIRAAGDGRVTYRGWKGGYGRLVEISHGGAMKTRYAHLRRYGPGIRGGVPVKKGQTIGYVGCSGLCTGPHLHFEMYQDDRYVDPLRVNIPVERQLDPLLMEIFKTTRGLFLERLGNGHANGHGNGAPDSPKSS